MARFAGMFKLTHDLDKLSSAFSSLITEATTEGVYEAVAQEATETYPGRAFVVVRETASRSDTHMLVDVAVSPDATPPKFTTEVQEGRTRAVGLEGTDIVEFNVEVNVSKD